MPKKFSSENMRAVAARERKKVVKDSAAVAIQQEIEQTLWNDDNKHTIRKHKKQEAEEKKRQQYMEKRAEVRALLANEMTSFPCGTKSVEPAKPTRAQIQLKQTQMVSTKNERKVETHLDVPLMENVNRLREVGEAARSVAEAITILSSKIEDIDRHPEKRLKSGYNAFEEKRLGEMRMKQPKLRQSQLKQIIFKEWKKMCENQLNQSNK